MRKQAIIVRFTNFRYRTSFYKARKETHVGVFLDLTKVRLDLLKTARDYIKEGSGIKFVYADLNCVIRAFTESGQHLAFNSLDELKKSSRINSKITSLLITFVAEHLCGSFFSL